MPDIKRIAGITITASLGLYVLTRLMLSRIAVVKVVRPKLSLLERWYAACYKRRRVTATLPGWTLNATETRLLLEKYQQRYSILRCSVENEEWAESIPSAVPLELTSQTLQETVERLLSENMCNPSPLWRVALNEKERFLVVMLDHVLSDGLGLAHFVRELSSEGGTDTPSFPPALEDHVDVNASLSRVLKAARGGDTNVGFVGPIPDSDLADPTADDKTIVTGFQIDAQAMKSIRKQARSSDVTIHSVLCACSAMALQRIVKDPCSQMKILVPISLRKNVVMAVDQPFGNYVAPTTVTLTSVSTSRRDVLSLAQQIQRDLKKDMFGAERELGLISLVPNLQEYRRKKEFETPLSRIAAIEVSNLGECESANPWYFAQGNHYVGPLFAINVVSHRTTQQMYVTVTARSLAVSRSDLERFRLEMAGFLLGFSDASASSSALFFEK